MIAPPPGLSNYFLALNGTPNGPHSASGVLQLLQQGSIQGTTLICREGAPAWVPVTDLEITLRMEAIPIMPAAPAAVVLPPSPVPPPLPSPSNYGPPSPQPAPSNYGPPSPQAPPSNYGPPSPQPALASAPIAAGYSGSRGSTLPRRYEPPVTHSAAAAQSDGGGKAISFGALLGAVALFFLPWLELRCASIKSFQQTGLQTVTRGYSVDDQMKTMAKASGRVSDAQIEQLESDKMKEEFSKEIGSSWFTGGAAFCIIIGLLASAGANGRQTAGIMALLALICLGMQMLSGFPLQQSVDEQIKKVTKEKERGASAEQLMAMRMITGSGAAKDVFQVAYTPWFYGELGLLGLATIVGFMGGGQRKT